MSWFWCVNMLLHIANALHRTILYVIPWPDIIVAMTLFFYFRRLVLLPRQLASLLLVWRDYLFFRPTGPQCYVSPVTYHAALLFPIHLSQALIDTSSMCLSCIRVPVQWCDGNLQRSYALRRRSRRFRPRSTLAFFGLLTMCASDTAYAIPSTGYGFVTGASNDNRLQERRVENILNVLAPPDSAIASVNSPPEGTSTTNLPHSQPDVNSSSDRYYKYHPEIFIADTDSYESIVDTGTNAFIVKEAGMLKNYTPTIGKVKGVNGTPTVFTGTGLLPMRIKTDCGSTIELEVAGVCIPSCPYNLMSPQLLVAELKKQGISVECRYDDETHRIELLIGNQRKTITSFAKPNRLFSIRVNEGYNSFFCHAVGTDPTWCSFAGALHVIPNDNDDDTDPPHLPREHPPEQTREHDAPAMVEDESSVESGAPVPSEPQQADFTTAGIQLETEDPSLLTLQKKQAKLATIHEQLGHFPFSRLLLMARAGLIPRELAKVPPPKCPGCAYGKAHRKPVRHKGTRSKLKQATKPGEVVSMDQLISPTAGFVPTHRGIPTTKRYIGATVFVDHYSDFTYVHLMTQMDGASTVEAKHAFERLAQAHGVKVQHYHSDNGLFDTKVFKDSVQASNQTISFCGPNAHHQNGKAENRIKDITTNARTALLHAAHRWPEAVNSHLWPAALKHYTNVRNAMPTVFREGRKVGKSKLEPDTYEKSPLSLFSGTEVEPNLDHFHPFGCPVYVLDSNLQAQQSLNKWSDRSKVGIFLCHSPSHATSVPLVLNTQTGNVAPQFHCIYDDQFATCKRDAKFVSLWQAKSKLAAAPVLGTIPRVDIQPTQASTPTSTPFSVPTQLPTPVAPVFNPAPVVDEPPVVQPQVNQQDESNEAALPDQNPSPPLENEAPHELVDPVIPQPAANQEQEQSNYVTRRSGRTVRVPRVPGFIYTSLAFLCATSPQSVLGNSMSLGPSETLPELLQPDVEAHTEPHPYALLSAFVSTSDPDTMTLDEALKQPDRDEFIKAMKKELMDHIERKHWKVVPIKNIPAPKKPIPMVWSMKRKRDPLGNIIKWKARLCAGGHKSVEYVDSGLPIRR